MCRHLLRLDVQNPALTIGAFPTGLLNQITHGSTLVQQPELAIGAVSIPGVAINPAIQHGPVKIHHQAANVAARVGLAVRVRHLQAVDVALDLVVRELVPAVRYFSKLAELPQPLAFDSHFGRAF